MSDELKCISFELSPNHLIRAHDQRLRNRNSERFRRLKIDHQLEGGELLDRQVTAQA
jgi:hypothetical protein